jgi:restriction system protein
MGSITCSIENFLDTIIDIVGIKSGIVLTKQEVVDILSKRYPDYNFEDSHYKNWIRIRSEDYEEKIRFVRIAIGNLEDKPPAMFSTALMPFFERGENIMGVMKAFTTLSSKYRNIKVDPDIIIKGIQKAVPEASLELIIAVIRWFIDTQEESYHITIPEREEWDGGTPLQSLFNCEIKSGGNYMDQKFLDYLAVNNDKLQAMHWRNFERFCAEFFGRSGYIIELGPGGNDGGVDIRAYDPKDPKDTLILIQCKRYKKGKQVGIEAVKSFYTDVEFEDASQGIIITTGQIAIGGKKVVSARKYPLTFAEIKEVEVWAKAMWKHSK